MAIIGILSAVILPPMIAKIEDAQTTNEDAKLEEIARALVKGIMVSGGIPNPNLTPFSAGGWASIAQPHTSLDGNSLLYVFPPGNAEDAEGENARRVYLDDTLMRYLASITGSANVPFPTPSTGWPVNTAGGVAFPNQAMPMYIVSGSKRGLDLYCTPNQPGVMMNPAPQDSPAFGAGLIGDLRNWVKTAQTTGPNAGSIMVPQSIARWGNNSGTMYRRGEFLHVKVVDLRPLFCRMNLRDLAAPPTAVVNIAGTHSYPSTVGDPVNGSALGYSFNFTPSAGFGNAFTGVEVGVLTTSLNQRILINRTAVLTGFSINDNGITPTPNQSEFRLNLPTAPQWEVNSLGINIFPAAILPNINSFSFYLIKGTNLKLYDSAATPNLLLNTQVTADLNFEFFNGSWTRVD